MFLFLFLFIYIYRCLNPGGYIEIHEYHMGLFSDDGSYNENTAIWKFYALVVEAAVESGMFMSTKRKETGGPSRVGSSD